MVKFDLDPPPEDILERGNWEILEVFLTALMASGASPKTVKSYRAAISDFLKFIGDKPLASVTSRDVVAWRSVRVREGFERGRRRVHPREAQRLRLVTLHYYTLFLRGFFSWLGLKVRVPVVRMPRKGEIEALTVDEINRLMLAARDVLDVLIVRLLFETGLRASEALSVRVVDVDFSRGEIRVKAGKYGEERTVFFTQSLGELMRAWIESRGLGPEDPLIPLSYPGLWKRLKSLARRAGVRPGKVRPHVLRHSFATEALRRGVNIMALQRILGHKDVKVTQVYTHLLKEDLRREYARAFSGLTLAGGVAAEAARCGACGSPLPAGARFCPYCGAPALGGAGVAVQG